MYESYCHEFKNSNPPRDVVNESKFIELWNVLFPTCIDRMLRSSEEKIMTEKLKEAHDLHRGGMFILEKNKYDIIKFLYYITTNLKFYYLKEK